MELIIKLLEWFSTFNFAVVVALCPIALLITILLLLMAKSYVKVAITFIVSLLILSAAYATYYYTNRALPEGHQNEQSI